MRVILSIKKNAATSQQVEEKNQLYLREALQGNEKCSQRYPIWKHLSDARGMKRVQTHTHYSVQMV